MSIISSNKIFTTRASSESLAQALHDSTSEHGKIVGRKVYLVGDTFKALSDHELKSRSDKKECLLMTANKIKLFMDTRPHTIASPESNLINSRIENYLGQYKDITNGNNPKASNIRNFFNNFGSKISRNAKKQQPGQLNSGSTETRNSGQINDSREKEKMKENEPLSRSQEKEKEKSSSEIGRSKELSSMSDEEIIGSNRAYSAFAAIHTNTASRNVSNFPMNTHIADSAYNVTNHSDHPRADETHREEFATPLFESDPSHHVSSGAVTNSQPQTIDIDSQNPVSAETLAKVAVNGKQWMDSVSKRSGSKSRLESSVSDKHLITITKNAIYLSDKKMVDEGNFKGIHKGKVVATRGMKSLKKQQRYESTSQVFTTQVIAEVHDLTNETDRAKAEKLQKHEVKMNDIVITKMGNVEGAEYLAPKYKLTKNTTRAAFIEGGNLKSALLKGKISYKDKEIPMTPELRLLAAVQMAKGMKALHQIGVIHRDLHPGNIMFKINDLGNGKIGITVKIIDFGLSAKQNDKPISNDAFKTHFPIEEIGNPNFKGTTPTFDQYQQAITLYQLFTGNGTPTKLPTFSSGAQDSNLTRGQVMDDVILRTYNKNPNLAAEEMNTPKEILVRQPECIKNWPGFRGLQPQVQNLLLSMLSPNPSARPSEEEVLQTLEGMSQNIENSFSVATPSSGNTPLAQPAEASVRTIYTQNLPAGGSGGVYADNVQPVIDTNNLPGANDNGVQFRPGDHVIEYGVVGNVPSPSPASPPTAVTGSNPALEASPSTSSEGYLPRGY